MAVHKLRVVYVDHVARLSGGELALLHTLPALLDQVDPLVVLAEDGPLVGKLRAEGIRVQVLPLSDGVRDLRRDRAGGRLPWRQALALARYVLALRRLLIRERAQVVHTNSLKSAFYGGLAGRLARVPVLWHVRDRIAADYLPARAVRLVRLASRILPDAIVANSQATLATLPQSHSGVLPSPVVRDNIGRVFAHVAAPPNPGVVIGLVGRLAPWKGQELFLRAFALAFPTGDVRAVLVGSDMFGEESYAAGLAPLAVALGIGDRVELRGFREDVWAELERLDVLVHCSTTPEPFGQVVLEGMAAGLCVLAADEGGPAEVVTHDVDGLLVPPRDAGALAEAMSLAAGSPELRDRLGAAGRQTALLYSPERTAAELLAVYAALAG